MNTLLVILAITFLVGLVYSSLKSYRFCKALTAERAKELRIEVSWLKLVKNPFYGIVITFQGLLEVLRIVLTIIYEFGVSIQHFVRSVIALFFKDHYSFAVCYNYVWAQRDILVKSDLENIAKFYDVPVSHLVRITTDGTFKTLQACIDERTKFADLNGEEVEQLLNSMNSLGIEFFKKIAPKK